MPILSAFLLIPWFRLEAWKIPLPFTLPLFGVDEIPIQPFGVLVAAGVLVGGRIAEGYCTRKGVHPSVVADFITHVVVCGFVGGYFLNAAFYEPDVFLEVLTDPRMLFKKYLGLSSFGGFFGAIGGAWLWKWRRKQNMLLLCDGVVTGFAAGWIFGRTGCFVVHDHPGRPSDFFLAVADYQAGAPPFVARHDLGLYEVIWAVAAFTLFKVMQHRKVDVPTGFYAGLLPVLYAPVRFFLDYLRTEPEQGGDVRYFGLTPGHYSALVLLAIGVAIMVWSYKHKDIVPRVAEPKARLPIGKQAGDASVATASSSTSVKKGNTRKSGKKQGK